MVLNTGSIPMIRRIIIFLSKTDNMEMECKKSGVIIKQTNTLKLHKARLYHELLLQMLIWVVVRWFHRTLFHNLSASRFMCKTYVICLSITKMNVFNGNKVKVVSVGWWRVLNLIEIMNWCTLNHHFKAGAAERPFNLSMELISNVNHDSSQGN